jgi:hypothetical protein
VGRRSSFGLLSLVPMLGALAKSRAVGSYVIAKLNGQKRWNVSEFSCGYWSIVVDLLAQLVS